MLKRLLLVLLLILFTASAYARDFYVVNAIPTLYDDQPAIAVIFSQQVDVKSKYDDFITVSGSKMKGIVDEGKQIIYYTGLSHGTVYNVKVSKGLVGVDGKLSYDFNRNVETNKIASSAKFASPGMLIIPSKSAVLPVTANNIDTILINYYYTPIEQAINPRYSSGESDYDDYGGYYSYENKLDFIKDANSEVSIDQLTYTLTNYEFVTSKSYSVDAINKQLTTNVEIPEELFAKPGIYAAFIQSAGNINSLPLTFFTVSDIGVQVRKFNDHIDVWTRSLTDGEVLKDVEIVKWYDGKSYNMGKTNSDGYLKIDSKNLPVAYLVAHKDNHAAIINTSKYLDLSEFDIAGVRNDKFRIFVYGPRDLYRGGETARWNIIVRDHDGKTVDSGPVSIMVRNARGQEADSRSVTLDKSLKYYKYSLDLASDAPTGTWNIEVSIGGTKAVHTFSVEDFMPETMRLILGEPGEPLIVDKSTATTISVLGEYLYGATASGNQVDGYYEVRFAEFVSSNWRDYKFGKDTQKTRSTGNYLNTKYLDSEGRTSWSIAGSSALDIDKTLSPVRVRYFVTLYESGGRAINRLKDYVYLPAGEAIGIKPANFKDYGSTTSENKFNIVKINNKGDATGGKVKVTLIKDERNYFWEYDSHNGWRYDYTSVPYPVEEKEITLGNKETEVGFTTGWGYYILKVQAPSGLTTSYEFRAGQGWWYDEEGGSSEYNLSVKPESLTILYDKAGYKPGDKAKVTITSPYDGKGKLMLENTDGLIAAYDISVQYKKATIEVPVGNWDRHDIYLSAFISRPESNVEKTQKSVVFGVKHFPLDRENRRIELDVIFPQSSEPGKEFEVLIRAKDKKYAKNTLVTLAAVDQGILSLKAFDTPDAWKHFFEKAFYSVNISDNFWQVVHKYSDKMAIRYGGDAELAAKGGELARADVKIISYFTDPIMLDDKGEARVKLLIPDFNGELRLMTMAFNNDSYGMDESVMKLAEPVVVELSMPRFLATGDTAQLTLDVRNMTGAEQDMEIDITATYPIQLQGKFERKIKMSKGAREVYRIPVEAIGTSGYADINVAVKGKGINNNKQWRLAVRPAYPAVTKTDIYSIKPNVSINFVPADLKNYIEDSAYLAVNIEAMPPLGLDAHLQSLLQYPYGCLEQTTSSTFPLLYASEKNIKKYNMTLPKGHTQKELVEAGLKRLASKQISSGGFGYWDSTSSESIWGTVYATELLNEAKRLGFNVDTKVLDKANARLVNYVRGNISSNYNDYYDRSDYFSLASKAYAAYVLSKAGQAPLSDVREIANKYGNINVAPVPFMHLAVALKNAGDKSKADEMYQKAFSMLKTSKYGYYGDYGSSIRDKVWVLGMALEYDKNAEKGELLYDISAELGSRRWFSTQERLRLLATALLLSGTETVKGKLTVNGKTEKINATDIFSKAYRAASLNKGVEFESENDDVIYARSEFIGYTKNAPKDSKENASITRHYYDIEGKSLDISNVKAGDTVVVELRYNTKVNTADGLIVDFIPAGFEIENQNLDNSIKLSTVKRPKNRAGRVVYDEYRDDRFVTAVNVYRDNTDSVFYIMRAVTPGTYTNPTTYFEDMYRPDVRAIQNVSPAKITVSPK